MFTSQTPLIEAIKRNNKEEVFRLLNLKTDLLEKRVIYEIDSEYGGGVLFWAAYYGRVDFINLLIRSGAGVNNPDRMNRTPIFIAAANGHFEAISALRMAGASIGTLMQDRITPFFIAAQNGNAMAINALNVENANVNLVNISPISNGKTPVYIAAENGHAVAITALYAAKADVNTKIPNGKTGKTPVYVAAENGHAAAITALHAASANINELMLNGKTPVYIAAENGHAAAITALHAASANINELMPNGKTPVYIAAENGHTEAITALLDAGADAKNIGFVRGWYGGTPLYIAKRNGHTEVVKLLEMHFKQYPSGIKPVIPSPATSIIKIPKKRQSVIQSPIEEKEKTKYFLEKLRTFFREGGDVGKKTEDYAIYNEYLRKAHYNAELIYNTPQNKHLLYVNDKPLDAEAAAEELSKIIKPLVNSPSKFMDITSSSNINISYQYEDNDIQAILSTRLQQFRAQNPQLFTTPIETLAAIDNILGAQLESRLRQESLNNRGARILLIPCNLGNAHWVGMLLEFQTNGQVKRAEYIGSLTNDSTVPETFQIQLQKIYPTAHFETCTLLQQKDSTSCGAYTIENLLTAALGIQSYEAAETIRSLHLEALRQYKPYFYSAFNERQRNNRPSTANLHEQLGYLCESNPVRFSTQELNRILSIKQCLSLLPIETQAALLQAFKPNSTYDDNHALHLNTIRIALQKIESLEIKGLGELMQLLFENWPPEDSLTLEKMKFRVSYNEILAVTQRDLESTQIIDLQKSLAEQIQKDEQLARELQSEWNFGTSQNPDESPVNSPVVVHLSSYNSSEQKKPLILTQFNQPTRPARRDPTRQLSPGFRNGLRREG
jgi:ankyrin repeat protein